jgi:hypothetical protein
LPPTIEKRKILCREISQFSIQVCPSGVRYCPRWRPRPSGAGVNGALGSGPCKGSTLSSRGTASCARLYRFFSGNSVLVSMKLRAYSGPLLSFCCPLIVYVTVGWCIFLNMLHSGSTELHWAGMVKGPRLKRSGAEVLAYQGGQRQRLALDQHAFLRHPI